MKGRLLVGLVLPTRLTLEGVFDPRCHLGVFRRGVADVHVIRRTGHRLSAGFVFVLLLLVLGDRLGLREGFEPVGRK